MIMKFEAPDGSIVENPNIEALRANMIDNFPDYWYQGSGDAMICCYNNDKSESSLLILPSAEHGIYLQYVTKENGMVKAAWVSMENPSNLAAWTECAYEWYASVGLFMPLEKAWSGIKYYLETGECSPEIDWIRPSEMPEESNW